MKDHEKEKYIVESQGPGEKEEVLTSAQYPNIDMGLFIQITRCVEENEHHISYHEHHILAEYILKNCAHLHHSINKILSRVLRGKNNNSKDSMPYV